MNSRIEALLAEIRQLCTQSEKDRREAARLLAELVHNGQLARQVLEEFAHLGLVVERPDRSSSDQRGSPGASTGINERLILHPE